MSKTLIERLVEKREKLDLDWQVPIASEARWWAETLADELEEQEKGLHYCDSFSCDSHRKRSHWIRTEITEKNNE